MIIRADAAALPLHLLIIDAITKDLAAVRLALNVQGFTLTEAADAESGFSAARPIRQTAASAIKTCGIDRAPLFFMRNVAQSFG